MNKFLPRVPQVPSPAQLIAPISNVERAVISAVLTPARLLGLPEPNIPGPASIVESVASQLPAPPQLPKLPELPELPGLPGR